MSSDYKYNGQEYDNSFGCSFPIINTTEELYSLDDFDNIIVIEDYSDISVKDIIIRTMQCCKENRWCIKEK